MQYAELFVKVFHSQENLSCYYFDFIGFVQTAFTTFKSLFDKLGEIHVHRLEENVQFAIVEVDVVCFHHVRAMRTGSSSFYLVKPL